jgi:acyl-CoA reductase-like NAD-dependent aldehyde dehydrogenase
MNSDEVKAIVSSARIAQAEWKNSSFATRKLLMRTMLRFITENQETCGKKMPEKKKKTCI